jgi:hypothetical protein
MKIPGPMANSAAATIAFTGSVSFAKVVECWGDAISACSKYSRIRFE